MAEGVRFTRESANRIARVVRQVEKQPFDTVSAHRRRKHDRLLRIPFCDRGILRKTPLNPLQFTVSAITQTRKKIKLTAPGVTLNILDNGVQNFVVVILSALILGSSQRSVKPTKIAINTVLDPIAEEDEASGFGEGTLTVLGTVTALDGAITELTQLRCGGDIDDDWTFVDSSHVIGGTKISTMGRRTGSASGYGQNSAENELNIFEADKVVLDGGYSDDMPLGADTAAVPVLKFSSPLDSTNFTIRWIKTAAVTNFDVVTNVNFVTSKQTKRSLLITGGVWKTIGAPFEV